MGPLPWLLLSVWSALPATTPIPPRPVSRPGIAGIVTDPALGELSGLAASRNVRDRYWAINDGGNGNELLLLDSHGRVLREFAVTDAVNTDWEDLASFHWRGSNWLLISDTGDNTGSRSYVSLWMVREPDLAAPANQTGPAQELRVRYPDAPHDVESMTVDAVAGEIYLLSKRTVPPVLYKIPLAAATKSIVTAAKVASLDAIPQPTEREIARDGSLSRFRSQTTAMELDCSRRGLLVLTYDAVYRYRRAINQTWESALPAQRPARSSINLLPQAEAMALDHDCGLLYVGSEKAPVPLLRYRYRKLPEAPALSPAQAAH